MHLALMSVWQGGVDSNHCIPESKSGAFTTWLPPYVRKPVDQSYPPDKTYTKFPS